jgi:hypothetical protein
MMAEVSSTQDIKTKDIDSEPNTCEAVRQAA